MLGNIKFIGELFAQKILNEKIMHDCVKRLLESKEEDTIECLCKLMATIGKLLDREEARHYMDYYFDQMKQTAHEIGSNPAQFPSGVRLKFMILDTIDLRKNRYVLPFVLVLCLATFCRCCTFVPGSVHTHNTTHTHTHKHTHTHTTQTHTLSSARNLCLRKRAVQFKISLMHVGKKALFSSLFFICTTVILLFT